MRDKDTFLFSVLIAGDKRSVPKGKLSSHLTQAFKKFRQKNEFA